MSAIADGLIVEARGFVETGQPNVLRPVYGSLKSMNVQVETLRVYNEDKSNKSGVESYTDEEVVFFQTDKYSKVPVRVSKLSREYSRDLGHLIQAHREQKDIDELKIMDWQAIGGQEKRFVLDMQVYTVNQLAHFPKTEAHKLGPDGRRLIELAERHVATKEAEKKEKEEASEAVKILRAQNEELMRRLAALEASKKEDVIEVEAKKAIRKKKIEESNDLSS